MSKKLLPKIKTKLKKMKKEKEIEKELKDLKIPENLISIMKAITIMNGVKLFTNGGYPGIAIIPKSKEYIIWISHGDNRRIVWEKYYAEDKEILEYLEDAEGDEEAFDYGLPEIIQL